MLNKKGIVVALACALALGAFSTSALADPINVDGVLIDPDSPLDLNIQAVNFRETSVAGEGDVVTGYGQIGTINGNLDSVFCPSCDLTFTFQYTVSHTDTSGANPQVVFDNGSINLYVVPDGSFHVEQPATANPSTGSLWLSLIGHASNHTGFTVNGELFATLSGTIANPTNGSSGFGLLDATGGPARSYADFNNVADGLGGFADLTLDSSFQFQDTGVICTADGAMCFPITGEGSMIGKATTAVSVPEPGTVGLLGLGLGFLGLLLRRRRKVPSRHV